MEISKKTEEKIYSYVKKDLTPSIWAVVSRIVISLSMGGFLSMMFCGQFGVGFSEMARHWNHTVHASMGSVQCAIICGSIFAIVPVLVLRSICSGLLFRKIIKGYGVAQGGLLTIMGIAMYSQGTFMNEAINISLWAASAYITYKLFGLIIDQSNQMFRSLNKI